MKQMLMPTPVMATFIAAVALFFAIGGYRLGLWEGEMPGAGLLPFATALLLLPLIARVFFERTRGEEPFRLRPLLAVFLLAIYAATLPSLGFIIPTIILIAVWIRVLDGLSFLTGLAVAVTLALAGSLLFVVLLQVPMPLVPKFL